MALEEIGARLTLRDRLRFSREARLARGDIEQLADKTESAGRRARIASVGFVGFRGALGGLRTGIGLAATGIGVLGAAAGVGSVAAFKLASDANETAQAFGTTFGAMTAAQQKWVDQLHASSGMAIADLQDTVNRFGAFGKAAGLSTEQIIPFSQELTQAGLDIASFKNENPEEVFQAIQSGLAGEIEPLRRFSIFMSQAGLDAQAASMGFSGAFNTLSEGEKVMVRQAFIMANLGDAAGDLARTMNSPANQMRRIQGLGKELATTFGQVLLPAGEELLPFFGDKLAGVTARFSGQLPALQGRVREFARDLRGLFEAVDDAGLMTSEFGEAMSAFLPKELGDRVQRVWGQIIGTNMGTFDAALSGMIGADATTLVVEVMDAAGDLWVILRDGVIPALATLSTTLPIGPLQLLGGVLDFLADNTWLVEAALTMLLPAFAAYKTVMLFTGAFQALNVVMALNPIGLVVAALAALVFGIIWAWKNVDGFRDAIGRFAEFALAAFRGMVNAVLGQLGLLLSGAARAFGWIPGIGPKLRAAESEFGGFRDRVNASLGGVQPVKIRVDQQGLSAQLAQVHQKLTTLPRDMVVRYATSGAGIRTRQHGGPVHAGPTYLVGERGPELLRFGGTGTVTPMAPRPTPLALTSTVTRDRPMVQVEAREPVRTAPRAAPRVVIERLNVSGVDVADARRLAELVALQVDRVRAAR